MSEGSEEKKPEVVAVQAPISYCVVLSTRYEQFLKKDILSKKRGKNRKLTKDDKAVINAECADGINRFKAYAFEEAMRIMRDIAEKERLEKKKAADSSDESAAAQAVAVASAVLEEEKEPWSATNSTESASSSQKSE